MREILKWLQALAFVPSDLIVTIFELLKEEIRKYDINSSILEFYEYFENNYVGAIKKTRTKTLRLEPLFNYWSVYKRISHNIPRTTNFVESWHNSLGKNLKKHPIVYSLANSLRQEQLNNEN